MSKVNHKKARPLVRKIGCSLALFNQSGMESEGKNETVVLSRLMTSDGHIHWQLVHMN